MTLLIAICDDETKICAELERFLIDILEKLNIKYEIDVYFSGEGLCAKMEAGTHYDLIFLDIEFAKNSINGIETGRLIREAHRNHMVSIVYISWEETYSMQLFDIRPFNFLVKPLNLGRIEQIIRTYLDVNRLWMGSFTYKIARDTYKVQTKNIMYLQSVKRKLIMYMADGKNIEFYAALKDVYKEQLIKADFILIHSAYAVNFDYIGVMRFNEVVLTPCGTILPISQPKRKEVRDRYFDIAERRRV